MVRRRATLPPRRRRRRRRRHRGRQRRRMVRWCPHRSRSAHPTPAPGPTRRRARRRPRRRPTRYRPHRRRAARRTTNHLRRRRGRQRRAREGHGRAGCGREPRAQPAAASGCGSMVAGTRTPFAPAAATMPGLEVRMALTASTARSGSKIFLVFDPHGDGHPGGCVPVRLRRGHHTAAEVCRAHQARRQRVRHGRTDPPTTRAAVRPRCRER